MATQVIRFKVHRPALPDPAIRCFSADERVVDYAYVVVQVTRLFPGVDPANMVLTWKDRQGAEIQFSSDPELFIALEDITDCACDIFVKEQPRKTTESPGPATSSPLGATHDATCNHCKSPIVSIRYKCLTCADFDLCAACEKAGLHSHHALGRFCRPLEDLFKHDGVVCDHCRASPIRGIRFRCWHCPDFDLCHMCRGRVSHAPSHRLIAICAPVAEPAQPLDEIDKK